MCKSIKLTALLAAVFLAATYAGSAAAAPAKGFTVAKPEEWKEIPDEEEPLVFFTREGWHKQFILVQQRPLSKPFQFTQRQIEKGMTPEQAAEVILNEIAADQNIRDFKLLEKGEVQIAGQRGFRLAFVYTDPDNYIFKINLLGFIHGDSVFGLRYGATSEELFQKDWKTFQEVLQSFKLTARKAM